MSSLWTTSILAVAAVLGACSANEPTASEAPDAGTAEATAPSMPAAGGAGALRLELANVMPLDGGVHYEGWVIVNGRPQSTGKFNVNASGAVTPVGEPQRVDMSRAEAVVITIEPAGDRDTTPSAVKLLGGPVSGGRAQLSTAFPMALGTDLAGARGSYILATPSNGMNTNETSGLWFLNSPQGPKGPKVASLDLPRLGAGWTYEGWAVINGQPVSTGRFATAAGADSSARYSGSAATPPFPGEDYLHNAPSGLRFPTDLSGQMVVITAEPQPDFSPKPFPIKFLTHAIPSGARPLTPYMFENKAGSLPRGTATLG